MTLTNEVSSNWVNCKDQLPTIPGVYWRMAPDKDVGWQRWHGAHWGSWHVSFENAMKDMDDYKSKTQDGWWQGE